MMAPDPEAVASSLARLPTGYRDLFARLVAVCEPDLRIRALWVAGSVGRGVADEGSDLDVVVTVSDESYDEFCLAWRGWLADITPTIIARQIPGLEGSFYSVTTRCERFDVVVERASDIGSAALPARLVVLDRDGLQTFAGEVTATMVAEEGEANGPRPDKVGAIVEEFFRQQAIFPAAVVARQDWLLGVVGVLATHRMLYDLFVEANQPLPLMGIKQWSSRLTPSQRTLLESLPVPDPRHDEVVNAMLAVRRAMLTTGRETAEGSGVAWPTGMDAAVAAYYARELGTSSPATSSSDGSASALSTSRTTRIDNAGE